MLLEKRQLFFLILLLVIFQAQARQGQENFDQNNAIDQASSPINKNLTELEKRLKTINNNVYVNLTTWVDEQCRNDGRNLTTDLSVAYESLNKDVSKLKVVITTMQNESEKKRLPDNVAQNIKERKFLEAERKIIQMGASPSQITRIVNDVYNGDNTNFNVLHEYVKQSRNDSIRHNVLIALWYQLKSCDHMDAFQLISLYRRVRSLANEYEMETQVQNEVIQRAAETMLTAVPATNNQDNMANVQRLTKALHDTGNNIFKMVVWQSIRILYDLFGLKSKDEIVHAMHTLYNGKIFGMPLYVEVLGFISDELQHTGQLTDPATISIANNLRQLIKTENATLEQLQAVTRHLPASIISLFLSPGDRVRISNVNSKELYIPHNGFNALKDDDSVGEIWIAKKQIGLKYLFECERLTNHYLKPYFSRRTQKWQTSSQLMSVDIPEWEIVPLGDKVLVVYSNLNKTLCAGYEKEPSFVSLEERSVNSTKCHWQIKTAE